ncbi:hypothetical protein [Aureimonas psammosilenae]|uniref:hypothetical protein n=1 Tax=Aureimonas psammosilenae TaxID=2495496 RepID=UPI0012609084|nr:hypothetical protein [Aureimonas psammosilenae]
MDGWEFCCKQLLTFMCRINTNPCVRFLVAFFCTIFATTVAFSALMLTLAAAKSLPAPPLTGTSCIDEKFKFLANNKLDDVDFIAVGSSLTWRNVDVRAFEQHGLAKKAVNAAPCFLQISQTAFLTDFLLSKMPSVSTVLAVVAPRDFENCNAPQDSFFSVDQAAPYIFDKSSPATIYARNFRLIGFLTDAASVREARTRPDSLNNLVIDAKGGGPIEVKSSWLPAPKLDDACFDSLRELERVVNGGGAKLLVVSFPQSPSWGQTHDPAGVIRADFDARIRRALSDRAMFISQDVFHASEDAYADAVHLTWQIAQQFSQAIALAASPPVVGNTLPAQPVPRG